MYSSSPYGSPRTCVSQEQSDITPGITEEFHHDSYLSLSYEEAGISSDEPEVLQERPEDYSHQQSGSSVETMLFPDYDQFKQCNQDLEDNFFSQIRKQGNHIPENGIPISFSLDISNNGVSLKTDQKNISLKIEIPIPAKQKAAHKHQANEVVITCDSDFGPKVELYETLAEEEDLEKPIVERVLSHLLRKEEKPGKSGSYGNDQLCKKVIRKLCEEEFRQFKSFCNNEVSSDLKQRTDMLKSYLTINKGISQETLDNQENMKLAKELYFPLSMKRVDSTFGLAKEKRGREARNAFLRRGTKKEAKKFFTNEIGDKVFYGNFKAILEEFIVSDTKNGQPKLETFLIRLQRALEKIKENK